MQDDDLAQVGYFSPFPLNGKLNILQIRKARLEQLKQGHSDGRDVAAEGHALKRDAESWRHRQQEAEKEARQAMLARILEPAAAERLGRIRLVKAERAQAVEEQLLMLARSGQLRGPVDEALLKKLLEAVAEQREEERIVISRRKGGWTGEDDDLEDLVQGLT
ncbi:dsDNA-binding protein PDCD5 [Blumeria hordei DH14]|uniref:DsDNA-binding protein PDCD5 n=1 Tax=Blumeria graminis f. sp. hordei (strain DH14) TaxID=546991 RepID=N1JMY4_BLUG1|nr:dsDNA-binding protein PDCD5 [Blumeria hordei DH14]